MQGATTKIFGVGLNKTGTKTLGYYLKHWGFRHKTYDIDAFDAYRAGRFGDVFEMMQDFDSFEDWPWPLMFRELDRQYPEARFVLTVRRDPETWYRSLCNMAVRMGPFNAFERHIYGYSMPQGRRREHIDFYNAHNRAVEEHFRDRPGKLLRLCWEDGDDAAGIAAFLGLDVDIPPARHVNRSSRAVYAGDNLLLAQANRVVYQTLWHAKRKVRRLLGARRG